jgi:hypothetical protein
MAKYVKKTDQNKAWNKRTGGAIAYKLGSRTANIKRFLIICEGENTEPYYFKSFPVLTAEVEAFGIGRSKTSLVEQAIDCVSQEAHDPEREVWIVFDMDFDPAKTRLRSDMILITQFDWQKRMGFALPILTMLLSCGSCYIINCSKPH